MHLKDAAREFPPRDTPAVVARQGEALGYRRVATHGVARPGRLWGMGLVHADGSPADINVGDEPLGDGGRVFFIDRAADWIALGYDRA